MDPPPLHVLPGHTPPISANMTTNPLAASPTAVQLNHADSLESSPRSRPGDSSDHHLNRDTLPPVLGSKLRIMCSFGGHIMPRPHDKALSYVSGETRLIVIDRHSSFSSFCSRLSRTLLNGRPFTLKYQLPNEDLDSLVSITTDEDLENMVEEYDRLSETSTSSLSSSRIRLFLFVSKLETAATMGSLLDDAKSETWFVDALNGTGLLPRGHSDSAARNCLLNLDDSDLEAQAGEENKQQTKVGTEEVHQTMPDSPMVEKSSSFGSSSSSPSMSNLPPIRVRAEEQKVGIEEQFAQLSFAANVQKQDDGYGLVPTALPPLAEALADASINHTGINRVFSADEISDQGEPVGFRRPPLPLQPKAACASYNLPSPDSVASDSSIASANSFSNTVYYQDQQVNNVALRETTRATTSPNTNTEHSLPNSQIHIQHFQDSGYIFPPPQFNQQQQQQQHKQPSQQFVHPSMHYILDPASAQVSMASYYPVYAPSMQQQQQFHHHPADQNYPVYVMPVPQAQTYTTIQSNIAETSVVGSSRPLTPPNPNIVATSAAYRDGIPPVYPTKPAATPKPEIPASVYKATLTSAPQMVQVPSSQFHSQYVGFHPSQSFAGPPAASGANFGYELPSAAQDQVYYTQHQVAPLPSQYQTMTPAAAVAALANASKQLPVDGIKQQQSITSQPL